MHLGTAAAALLAHAHAVCHGGAILLRWDDLDPLRCRPEWVASLRADLAWLGLADWAEEVFQSARRAAYEAALLRLAELGRVYPCGCTRAEIRRRRTDQSGTDSGHYDGHCRGRLWSGAAAAEAHLASCRGVQIGRDRVSALRLLRPESVGDDPVIWSPEGYAAYTLACAVDEGDLAVTHVVRGADLLPETAAQTAVMAALGRAPPSYVHFPLVRAADGQKLSKSARSPALREMLTDPAEFRAWVGRAFFDPPVGPTELPLGWDGRLRAELAGSFPS